MNLSGQCVRAAVDYFKLTLENLLVVCDDFNLPLGRIRLRSSGSPGGHNGLADIIERLATDKFSRLRLGIGKPPTNMVDHVISSFSTEERSVIQPALGKCADAVEQWIAEGIQSAMNEFNADQDSAGSEEQGKKTRSTERPDPNEE
jgi:PTH1 family peptidyl-tRNA hydrolase